MSNFEKELEHAENTLKEWLKRHRYKSQSFRCCLTCKFGCQMSCEDETSCALINELTEARWTLGLLDEWGICDQYEPVKEVE